MQAQNHFHEKSFLVKMEQALTNEIGSEIAAANYVADELITQIPAISSTLLREEKRYSKDASAASGAKNIGMEVYEGDEAQAHVTEVIRKIVDYGAVATVIIFKKAAEVKVKLAAKEDIKILTERAAMATEVARKALASIPDITPLVSHSLEVLQAVTMALIPDY